jgi:uncharacterized protein (DUF433 family)
MMSDLSLRAPDSPVRDHLVADLVQRKDQWARLPIRRKIDYLEDPSSYAGGDGPLGSGHTRYVIEKTLEGEFPGISFRDSLSGREAFLTGHRVAVWEVVAVHEDTGSVEGTASHFRWPRVLVKRALAYTKAFPEEIGRARDGEADAAAAPR